MAWDEYKNIRRKVGCRLRIRHLSKALLACAPPDHEILMVKVDTRIHAEKRAVLAIWSYAVKGRLPRIRIEDGTFNRYTVTMVNVPEDPEWVVER